MQIDKLDELVSIVKDIKQYTKKIKDIQSKVDSLEGERKQILSSKDELIERIQQEFNCSLVELQQLRDQWIVDLDEGMEEVKRMLGE